MTEKEKPRNGKCFACGRTIKNNVWFISTDCGNIHEECLPRGLNKLLKARDAKWREKMRKAIDESAQAGWDAYRKYTKRPRVKVNTADLLWEVWDKQFKKYGLDKADKLNREKE